jgi:hypothetical protein
MRMLPDRFANELGDEGGVTREGCSPDHHDVHHGQIYVDLGWASRQEGGAMESTRRRTSSAHTFGPP